MVPPAGDTRASAPPPAPASSSAAGIMPTSAEAAKPENIVIIGAGPAGLTAAYALGQRGATCRVVEADTVVGGIARTVEREGWRFDIGGHRFFTKVPEVEAFWHEILGPEDFLVRPRLSRIYYNGKFFSYPIQLGNALKGLGLVESTKCGFSYLWVRIRRPKDPHTFEGWVASRFGWRLYRMFFKSYTEKVWGMPATEIQADWAAQRIKNLSLWKAVTNAVLPKRNQREITSLIEEFQYPRLGPGMMWERAAERVQAQGSTVTFQRWVTKVRRSGSRAVSVEVGSPGGGHEELAADHVISSMPISELVLSLDPAAPDEVQLAAKGLHYRDFLTVALVVPVHRGFPDNWIYVHDEKVQLGRIQNFGSWSPEMVKDGRTCLGLEYFVFEGDALWSMSDTDLVALGTRELTAIGLVEASDVERGYVVRMPKAYPVYDPGYEDRVNVIRQFLASEVPNVHPVGRNGMHRYNNQDHSMLTALLTVENLYGESYDTWNVNVEAAYHEEQVGKAAPAPPDGNEGGTGRSAPVLPVRS
ncbi:MAG TPA: NAD(P)/FAD-dependent oxidoreductase [Acidimicrobiales bacterium]|nr:NAD(P)/FAD-dependent oxidoreductase [Acidimicrobiales bacterium]